MKVPARQMGIALLSLLQGAGKAAHLPTSCRPKAQCLLRAQLLYQRPLPHE